MSPLMDQIPSPLSCSGWRVIVWKNVCALDLSYTGGGGGGGGRGEWAQSTHTNFKDLYLYNKYCYCNKIWWLFTKFIEDDNDFLLIPYGLSSCHGNNFFENRFDNFYKNFPKIHFYFKFYIFNVFDQFLVDFE